MLLATEIKEKLVPIFDRGFSFSGENKRVCEELEVLLNGSVELDFDEV